MTSQITSHYEIDKANRAEFLADRDGSLRAAKEYLDAPRSFEFQYEFECYTPFVVKFRVVRAGKPFCRCKVYLDRNVPRSIIGFAEGVPGDRDDYVCAAMWDAFDAWLASYGGIRQVAGSHALKKMAADQAVWGMPLTRGGKWLTYWPTKGEDKLNFRSSSN